VEVIFANYSSRYVLSVEGNLVEGIKIQAYHLVSPTTMFQLFKVGFPLNFFASMQA
jgi:hypothetical protein